MGKDVLSLTELNLYYSSNNALPSESNEYVRAVRDFMEAGQWYTTSKVNSNFDRAAIYNILEAQPEEKLISMTKDQLRGLYPSKKPSEPNKG